MKIAVQARKRRALHAPFLTCAEERVENKNANLLETYR
jgi:hypothetical protein